jgi:hypothetical protein
MIFLLIAGYLLGGIFSIGFTSNEKQSPKGIALLITILMLFWPPILAYMVGVRLGYKYADAQLRVLARR